ncbi:MAG: efflux RND transporter periplasmic adaptor subunit [Acidobacteriota bacterium]
MPSNSSLRAMARGCLSVFLLLAPACGDGGSNDHGSGAGSNRTGSPRAAAGHASQRSFPMGGYSDAEAVSVKAYRAGKKPISKFLISTTTLESIRKVTIYAKINALVNEIRVEEGSSVGRGQVLAQLDDREIRNELEQAQIALKQARLALQQAEVKTRLSESNFLRSKSLFEQNLISRQEFDQSSLTRQTDALGLKVARQQSNAAEARLEAAQIQLDYTQIPSSIEGVVTRRLIEVGSRVNTNQAVFEVEDFSPLWARIYLPEKELPQVRKGQTARIIVQAFPDRHFEARVRMINPTVDAESGTVKVTLEVPRGEGLLRPGMFGSVYMATDTHPDAIVIPKRAVLRERDENRVFVIGPDDKVEKRVVALGFSQDDEVEIVRGVNEGDSVVTVGQEGLNDGYPVAVLAWEGEAQPQRASIQPPTAREQPSRTSDPPLDRTRPARRSGRTRAAGGSDRAALFLQRMLQNPSVKAAYEERLKENPDFMKDPAQRRRFFMDIRQKLQQGRDR